MWRINSRKKGCEIPPQVNSIFHCLLQVGNALTDDFHDQLGMFQFMWTNGMISDQTFKLLNLLCDFQSVKHPSESCEKIWEIAEKELGNIDPYSIFTTPCHANDNQIVKRKHLSLPCFYYCLTCVLYFLGLNVLLTP